MKTREEIIVFQSQSAPAFGGLLYIGCTDINAGSSSIKINVSSLEQEYKSYKLYVGEVAKYTVNCIAQFSLRLDKVHYGSEAATLVVTMLDNLSFATLNSSASISNVRFTESEISHVRKMLEAVKERVTEKYSPSEGCRNKVYSRIDAASQDLEVANRIDWARIFVSTMIGVSLDLGFANDFPEFLMAATRRVIETVAQISADILLTKEVTTKELKGPNGAD
jgi:hypothetical protein